MNYLLKSLDNYEIFRNNEYHKYKNTELFLNKEPYLDIVLTDYCNRKCKFCVADLVEKKNRSYSVIFQKQIRYAIDNFGIKEVLLVGGEPTLAHNLFHIIEFLTHQKEIKKICLTTNGDLLKTTSFRQILMSSGVTHINLSIMSLDVEKQQQIGGSNSFLTLSDLKNIYEDTQKNKIELRINNNIFKENNDTLQAVKEFYKVVKDYCDSIKFSPLLRVDNFSVVNEPKQWVNENILSNDDYENLFKEIELSYKDFPIVRNPLTFGFVEYSMIMLNTPIIINYNHRGLMAQKASQGLVNNIKLLTNGNLSLSWNSDDITKVIRFSDKE